MTNKEKINYKILSEEGTNKNSTTIELNISQSNNMYVIHRALIKQLNNKRYGNANCKTRSDVRGGGKKPWKQKGTGKARAGSTRSPLWKGGGVIFGPKTKKYTQKINKKEQKLALRNLLYNKEKSTNIVENFSIQSEKPSTKDIIKKIHSLKILLTNKILIIVAKKDPKIYLSVRNIQNIEIIAANQINLLSIIRSKKIIIEKQALDIITRTYNG
uniref:Large ribosomal subunit protein uL4c n=1 Tax=Synarthrophyton chejuense TaxID=2485825 RepID=A0A3G3MFX7_9FLOR|nr:ribosomal protein L4 [Synarthrophyton chejuense]AYR05733.1 ribosomal protein L4 [Synarthrophyton chejuense]